MLAVVRRQEECNCPNWMAWWLFLPLDACPTLYRCMSTFSASTAQLFLCMAGITTMCSIKKSYTSHPNTHQTQQSSSQASIAAAVLQLQPCFRSMARELLFRPHFPSQELPVYPGKSKSPNSGGDERRESTVDFNSHKKLLPPGTRCHHSYFSPLSLQTKIYQLDSTAAPWKGSDLTALHPVIPKTPPHLLFSLVDFCLVDLSTQR